MFLLMIGRVGRPAGGHGRDAITSSLLLFGSCERRNQVESEKLGRTLVQFSPLVSGSECDAIRVWWFGYLSPSI